VAIRKSARGGIEVKIVIRAGGTGTRLWPWSRAKKPKQFLPMFGDRSCVQKAFDRFTVAELATAGDIYVSVGRQHAELAREQLPELPDGNFIVEPAKMDTGPAIGLETVVVAGDDPDVIIASLGSDHHVGKPDAFIDALKTAESFLRDHPQYLLTIACNPTRIETEYGHIKKGPAVGESHGQTIYGVEEFTEKPDYPTAKQYTESGEYLWNANFFAWTSGTLMQQFEEFEPEMHAKLSEILSARGSQQFQEVLNKQYPQLKKVAVDYAILEPAARKGRLAVLPVDMQWSDIGSWASITDAFPPDEDGNFCHGPAITEDTTDTTIHVTNPARRLVATIGVEGLAIVDTGDALLILPKAKAGQVKALIEKLKESEEYSDII
jgi:mannose-1-phosphate guanylyltransferase